MDNSGRSIRECYHCNMVKPINGYDLCFSCLNGLKYNPDYIGKKIPYKPNLGRCIQGVSCIGCNRDTTVSGKPLQIIANKMCKNCNNKKTRLTSSRINCSHCGKLCFNTGHKSCSKCFDEYHRIYLECITCGNFRRKGTKDGQCISCRQQERKLQVYLYYCDDEIKCQCCGETEYDFMTLDHINNDGGKRRKESKQESNPVGFILEYYRKYKKYPEDWQVLCMNCNHSKGKKKNNGKCIHHA